MAVHRHDEVAAGKQLAELHPPVRAAPGHLVGIEDRHADAGSAPRDFASGGPIADQAEHLARERRRALLEQIDYDVGIRARVCHGTVIRRH
ncbi:MAG TPA: hypothetical protein VEQ87_13370 [Burkholderiales bacterium]|nr:hypothetical protein [Burkholderiales bacterium]